MVLTGLLIAQSMSAQSFTVTFDKQGGTDGTNQITTVADKPMPVALSPAKEGYVFNGYFDAASGGKQYYSPAMASLAVWDKNENATLYARWTTLPASFSWGNYSGSNWLSVPKNQGACGSCWAFSMVASYEARKRIAENQPAMVLDLSEQHIVSCWKGDCNGGGLPVHWDKFRDEGVPDEACFPYVATAVPCSNGCSDWTTRVYKAATWSYLYQASVEAIKKEIMVNGPVYANMEVYEDLYSYASGVYSHFTGNYQGTKAIIVYGWDDANNCWLVVNTWGTNWGETGPGGTRGFFRVSISSNNCKFAEWVFRIRPVRDYILNYPNDLELGSNTGSEAVFSLSTETDWTVSDDASWLSLSTAGATGNAVITATAAEANTSETPRTATITIKARRISDITITVTQQGNTSGTDEFDINSAVTIKVYPVPFTDHLTIENSEGIEKIVLTTLSGQLITIIEPGGANSITIPTVQLPGGTYLLKISHSGGKTVMKRVIKPGGPPTRKP